MSILPIIIDVQTILEGLNSPRLGNACIDGLVQDCSISNAVALEILQSYTKPSICIPELFHHWFNGLVPDKWHAIPRINDQLPLILPLETNNEI